MRRLLIAFYITLLKFWDIPIESVMMMMTINSFQHRMYYEGVRGKMNNLLGHFT